MMKNECMKYYQRANIWWKLAIGNMRGTFEYHYKKRIVIVILLSIRVEPRITFVPSFIARGRFLFD